MNEPLPKSGPMVRIRYWLEETATRHYWTKTDPMRKKRAEALLRGKDKVRFPYGTIVEAHP
jgi:hypothetical protein